MTQLSAVSLGSISAGLSSATLATAWTGFGVVASPALAGVASVFGLLSAGFTVISKRLEKRNTKHEKLYTLALADKRISDSEFTIILRDLQKYHEL